jgi:hypothetical protein
MIIATPPANSRQSALFPGGAETEAADNRFGKSTEPVARGVSTSL